MSENALQARADAIAARLRQARALLDTRDVDDLKGVKADISALCRSAQQQGDDAARAALHTALDALGELEEELRARRDAIQDKLGSAPDRKRALSAYSRRPGG